MFGEAGSNAVKSMLQKSIMGGLVGTVVSPIKEVFEEIIKDGFREALIENAVSILGGTDDLGFWLSSLSTSVREVKGALGELTFGKTNLKNTFSFICAISSVDSDTKLEIQQSIAQDLKQRQEAEKAKQAQMSFLDKMLKTDFLKGLFMVIPSVFFGSFGFVALSGLNKMVTSAIKLSPAAYAELASLKHNSRKKLTGKAVGSQETDSVNIEVLGQTKKPAELDSVAPDIDNEFKDLQESDRKSAPLIQVLSNINPNPKNARISNILNKFRSLISSTWSNKFEAEKIEDSLVVEDIDKIVDKSVQSKEPDVKLDKINNGDDFEGLFPEHDKDAINYIHSKLFDPEYDQNKPKDVLGQINYRCSLISEARQVLKSTKYYGLDILIDEIINPYVLAILQDKFNKGEEFSKLEKIIADVASFYMGGPQVRHDGGYNQDTIREYEEETGKKAFLSNSPTKSFKKWFSTRQVRDAMLKKVDGLVKTVVDDYMDSLDKAKLQFRQLHFQDYVSDPSDVDKIYNNRKKYVWTGIVYRITELKEENGKIVEGRKLYGFTMDDLESRWEGYKKQAFNPNKPNQRIHDGILEISEKIISGEIDGDIDDWFKMEVVEVHWNEHSMRQRERDWIKKDNTRDPAIGFNTKPGGEGGPKIHIPTRLLAEYIAMGLKVSEIKIKLKNHGIVVSWRTVNRRINELFGSFFEARKIFLKPVINQLIKEGYKKKDINECFKTKTKDFLSYLLPKLFGENYRALHKSYLLEKVSAILETGSQVLTYGKIQSLLPLFGKREINNLIEGKWGGILNAKIQFGREIAIYLFRKEASVEHILRALGYSEGTIRQCRSNIDRIFKKLFDGMTADEAREHFTSGYKNVEGHFIWYSDLDNY